MDRVQYLEIRKKLQLEYAPFALAIHILQNLGLLGAIAGIWLASGDFPTRYGAVPLTAILIFRGFSMMHEAVHKAASKNMFRNDVIGVISGAICLLAYEPWKRSHLEHHLWSGNIDKDPVMALIVTFPKMSKTVQKTLSLFWHIWFPILACMQYLVFWSLALKIFCKKPEAKVLASILFPLSFWAGLFYFLPAAFSVGVLIPALFVYMVAVEVVNFPHHLQLPQYKGDKKLMVWEQHEIARTCVYPKWFGRFVVLNFNYHIEHHMYPDVPWYHLEKLHLEVHAALKNAYNTDPYFEWILTNKPLPIGEVLKASTETSRKKEAA